MRKIVYVYDAISKELIKKYDSSIMVKKDLKMGYDTLKKYLNSDKLYPARGCSVSQFGGWPKKKFLKSISLNKDDK